MTPRGDIGSVRCAGVGDRGERDAGYATVAAAGAIAVVATMLAVLLALGAAVATRHRAEVAADLAALAGAAEAVRGRDAACARAADLASRNGATLVDCSATGWDLTVVVTRRCRCLPVADTAIGRARAGPVVRITP